MISDNFYEMILDNLSDAIYVLDSMGNFLFVNSSYSAQLHMSKDELLKCNVHDFLSTGQINSCISDLVYREKRQIVQFQDVYDTLNVGRKPFRQLVVSTPIFDKEGNVCNVLAVLRPLEHMNNDYYAASQNEASASYSKIRPQIPLPGQDDIVASSDAMRGILSMVSEIANTDATVLITGESGTGKEVIAHFVHECSDRKANPLVVVNCASLPENLLEAELFGYDKGAFTGAAVNGKKGLFECADGGTLFLDEINSLPLSLQGKLLRAIETKTIQRLGGQKTIHVDFRLLVATNQDIRQMVKEQKFRSDLYYRIDVVPIVIPPLRERRSDIVPLALKFLEAFCKKNGKNKTFSPQMLENMTLYDWPGNVRELKNFVERSVLLSVEQDIKLPSIKDFTGNSHASTNNYPYNTAASQTDKLYFANSEKYEKLMASGLSMQEYIEECERDMLRWALTQYKSTYKAAEALGISQAAVMRKKKKYFNRLDDISFN